MALSGEKKNVGLKVRWQKSKEISWGYKSSGYWPWEDVIATDNYTFCILILFNVSVQSIPAHLRKSFLTNLLFLCDACHARNVLLLWRESWIGSSWKVLLPQKSNYLKRNKVHIVSNIQENYEFWPAVAVLFLQIYYIIRFLYYKETFLWNLN